VQLHASMYLKGNPRFLATHYLEMSSTMSSIPPVDNIGGIDSNSTLGGGAMGEPRWKHITILGWGCGAPGAEFHRARAGSRSLEVRTRGMRYMRYQRWDLIVAAVVVAALASVASATPNIEHRSNLEISIDSGPLVGSVHSGVRRWLGIPYAEAPVGQLRWKPPQQPASWQAPRMADRFGASCAQYDTMGSFAAPSLSEDCLNLNVYAPRETPVKGAPVMVWIFGGSFVAGSASDYDPTSLVRQGAVVVTVNYRLGMLGFFSDPSLGIDNASGNYGLLDQTFALQWVRKNIAAFGGDPRRVTIFGESSGARAVAVLLASPPARELFSGAIMQSMYYDGTKDTNADTVALGRRFAMAAGCKPEDVECLRDLSVEQILDAQRRISVGRGLAVTVGGPDYPEPLELALRKGDYNHVPLIVGWDHDEGTAPNAVEEIRSGKHATEADYVSVTRQFARHDTANKETDAAAIAAAYPLSAFSVPALATAQILTDSMFVCGTRRFLRDLSDQSPAWSYEFDVRDAPQLIRSPSFPVGAAHASEIQFIFGGFHGATGQKKPLSRDQNRLALQMQRLWVNMATSGDPNNGKSALPWPKASTTGSPVLLLSTSKAASIKDAYDDRHCDLWDDISDDRQKHAGP
jgi:para-nitrobenzyl esterase